MRVIFLQNSMLVLLLLFGTSSALTTKVLAREKECYTETIAKNVQVSFQFQVTAGGQLDIDASLSDAESGGILEQWKGAKEGQHIVQPNDDVKTFTLCFDNYMARFTPKWVNFYIYKWRNPNVAKVGDLDPVEKAILKLNEQLGDLQDEQRSLRTTEHQHRDTIEVTSERLLYWSVFEAVVLVLMGSFQMYYLKRFLEVRSSV